VCGQSDKDGYSGSAYDTKGCYAAIAQRNAAPIIPTPENEHPWKEDTWGAKARNESLLATRHLGRALWKNGSSYQRRSLVETKMRCFKLLVERVIARNDVRGVNP